MNAVLLLVLVLNLLLSINISDAFIIRPTSRRMLKSSLYSNNIQQNNDYLTKSKLNLSKIIATMGVISSIALNPSPSIAKPEGVNRPDLLPKEFSTLIDVSNFLSKGQEKKVKTSIEELEKSTGFKLRVLCQSYPETPGLAIKDYWGVDDKTVVLVVDKGEGFNRKGIPTNIINLNIGKTVDEVLPAQFWQRLTNKLGNQPYVKANGEDTAVLNAVEAITYCLQEKGEKTCTDIPFVL